MNWSNWSGSVRSNPTEVIYPSSEGEIVELVKRASEAENRFVLLAADIPSHELLRQIRFWFRSIECRE